MVKANVALNHPFPRPTSFPHPSLGTAPGRWLIHEHSMPERLPHRKPGTAGGQYRMRLLCAVAAAPILARSDRQCTRVTATLAYGAQASMIELGSSICAELHY